MPEYLSPGVYVEEIDAGPKPIEGVSTSTAGAVGVTARGPTDGKPKLVTSFADFVRIFGGFLPAPDTSIFNKWALDPTEGGRFWQFPLSVKGFFDNGGQRLYVKRVFSAQATASSSALGVGFVGELEKDVPDTGDTLKLRHLINIDAGAFNQVFVHLGDGSAVVGPLTVDAYNASTNTITLSAPIGQALKVARGDFVRIHAITGAGTPPVDANTTLAFSAKAKGAWGNDLSVRVRPVLGATLNILPDPGAGDVVNRVTTAPAVAGTDVIEIDSVASIAAGDHLSVGGREYEVNSTGVPNPTSVELTDNLADDVPSGTSVKKLREAALAADTLVYAWGAASLYANAIVELDNGTNKVTKSIASVNGNQVTFATPLGQDFYETHKLRVIEAEVSVRYAPPEQAETLETFTNLRLVDDGSLSSLVNHVNTRSELVNVATGGGFSASSLAAFPSADNGAWQSFGGGNDQLTSLSVDDFVGVDAGSGKRTGIQALEDIDEVSLCLAPGIWSGTVHNALIQHCEVLKDRFAIVDPQDGLSIEGIRAMREVLDTKYAALYYPWLELRDPSVKRNVNVAPSAHMAGVYARVDVERGVHKAPANEVIRGITKIAQDVTKREQDLLNPKGINALRFFPGRGNRVWGARTLSSDASWKYINVRRLFIMVEESIEEGTQWVVFEPNDEPLWARVRQTITNFLTSVWRSGALQGATTDEAFFVKCDRSTMTQDDIDNGRLICVIGIAPVKPAEFVIFRIQQKTLDSQQG